MGTKVYAYFIENENKSEILETWEECQKATKGKKARYKSFKSLIEAQNWLENGAVYEKKSEIKSKIKENLPEGIYFDAGTGRGIGVEVRVTNVKGESILHLSNYSQFVNEFGNINLGTERTNNYGELLGLYIALEIANKTGIKKIYGDSNLVLSYWSKGAYKNDLPEKTLEFIKKTIKLRANFEISGGVCEHISGDYNPADLGFHK